MEALSAWLKATGTTQSELARDLDVTQAAISDWCTGKTSPSKTNLRKLCVRTGLSADALLLDKDEVQTSLQ